MSLGAQDKVADFAHCAAAAASAGDIVHPANDFSMAVSGRGRKTARAQDGQIDYVVPHVACLAHVQAAPGDKLPHQGALVFHPHVQRANAQIFSAKRQGA
jgi:hypothetical protein